MLSHYFKIIWNRKKQNFLLMLELFIAFLVLCVLFVQGSDYLLNYRNPLGYSYENIWMVYIDPKQDMNFNWTESNIERMRQLNNVIKQIDGTIEVAGVDLVPFSYSNWNSSDSLPTGKQVLVERSAVTDEYLAVMGLEMVQGSWFGPEHNGLPYTPVVINESYAKAAFPGQDPIGKRVLPIMDDLSEEYVKSLAEGKRKEEKVVGVVKAYKKNGELEKEDFFAFRRTSKFDTLMTSPPRNLAIKVEASAMNAAYEEKLINALEMTIPDWTFRTQTLADVRKHRMTNSFTPLISFGIVALFLILMVGLGLVGVIWQNVTARVPEMGLRRAVGADATHIFRQVLGELLILASVSLVLGSLIVLQFPLLNIVENLPVSAYLVGWALSVIFILMVTIVCGLYPSKLATGIQPTEALHDE